MRLDVHAQGIPLTERLRAHIDRQVQFALSAFGSRIRHVRVQLRDLNGPRGGEDVHCQIQARLEPRGDVIIKETRADSFGAVARATDRVKQAVSRQLARARARRRRRV